MKNPRWAALLGMAALLASAPAVLAAEITPREAAKDAPRVASAKAFPAPAPASPRLAPSEIVPGMIGERTYAPAERMADTIAEYYASGKMRLY